MPLISIAVETIATTFEKRLVDIFQQVDKQKENIVMIKEDAKKNAKAIESNIDKMSSKETQLEEPMKREKLAKNKTHSFGNKKRKHNLMFFAVPEETNAKTEHVLKGHIKNHLKVETPCIIHNQGLLSRSPCSQHKSSCFKKTV